LTVIALVIVVIMVAGVIIVIIVIIDDGIIIVLVIFGDFHLRLEIISLPLPAQQEFPLPS